MFMPLTIVAILPRQPLRVSRWGVWLLALLLNGCISSKGIIPASQPLAQDKLALGKAIEDASSIAWPTEH